MFLYIGDHILKLFALPKVISPSYATRLTYLCYFIMQPDRSGNYRLSSYSPEYEHVHHYINCWHQLASSFYSENTLKLSINHINFQFLGVLTDQPRATRSSHSSHISREKDMRAYQCVPQIDIFPNLILSN